MTTRFRRKLCNQERYEQRADYRNKNNKDAPRTGRGVAIRVIEKGKMPQEKQIMDEPDEPAKCDSPKPGDNANENRNQREAE
jgi:hypothetical protein